METEDKMRRLQVETELLKDKDIDGRSFFIFHKSFCFKILREVKWVGCQCSLTVTFIIQNQVPNRGELWLSANTNNAPKQKSVLKRF